MLSIKLLLTIFVMSALWSGCGNSSVRKDERNKPAKVWTVKAGIANTPYYDGICGSVDEHLVVNK